MEKPSESFENQERPKLPKITLENWRSILRDSFVKFTPREILLELEESGETIDGHFNFLEKTNHYNPELQNNVDYVQAIADAFDNTDPNVMRQIPNWAFHEFAGIANLEIEILSDLNPMSPEEEQEMNDSLSREIKLARDFIKDKGLDCGDSHPKAFLIYSGLLDEFRDWRDQKGKKISLGKPLDRNGKHKEDGHLDDFFGKN